MFIPLTRQERYWISHMTRFIMPLRFFYTTYASFRKYYAVTDRMDAILSQKAFMIHSNLCFFFHSRASAACVHRRQSRHSKDFWWLWTCNEWDFCDRLRQNTPNFLKAFDLWLEGFALILRWVDKMHSLFEKKKSKRREGEFTREVINMTKAAAEPWFTYLLSIVK